MVPRTANLDEKRFINKAQTRIAKAMATMLPNPVNVRKMVTYLRLEPYERETLTYGS